jgi:hypothetical protein
MPVGTGFDFGAPDIRVIKRHVLPKLKVGTTRAKALGEIMICPHSLPDDDRLRLIHRASIKTRGRHGRNHSQNEEAANERYGFHGGCLSVKGENPNIDGRIPMWKSIPDFKRTS